MRKAEALFLAVVVFQIAVFLVQVPFDSRNDPPLNEPSQSVANSLRNSSFYRSSLLGANNNAVVEVPKNEEENRQQTSGESTNVRLTPEAKRVRRLRRRQQELALTEWANQTVHLPSTNYYNLTEHLYPNFSLIPELVPLKIMRRYIHDFSQERLEQLWLECSKDKKKCQALESTKFIVGSYSCPLEAGNRLHKFMNSLIWAILTNRFFLWVHFDTSTCRLEEEELAEGTCDHFIDSVDNCRNILQLSEWVPSWNEWSVRLNLSLPTRACGIGQRAHDTAALPMDAEDTPRVLRIGQQVNLETGVVLGNPNNNYRRRLLSRKAAIVVSLQLFKHGYFFTYGMLFEALFTLDKSVLPDESMIIPNNDEADTYGLHSRHPPSRSIANEIGLELDCMRQLLGNRTLTSKPCIVYVMTDREETLPLLTRALEDSPYRCTVVTANASKGSNPFRTEHGSFAGKGFFQDLALLRHARSGFMAPHLALRSGIGIRTSSALAREMMEFRRILETRGGWDGVADFKECFGRLVD